MLKQLFKNIFMYPFIQEKGWLLNLDQWLEELELLLDCMYGACKSYGKKSFVKLNYSIL